MKDPDQPELNDPRRKEYDFLQARAAQAQMSSQTFGSHHSAILPDGTGGQAGTSKKTRLDAMISEAVQSAVTQITADVLSATQAEPIPPARRLEPEQPQNVLPNRPEQGVMQAVGFEHAIQPQIQQAAQQQPAFVESRSGVESTRYQTPQVPELPADRSQPSLVSPPSLDEIRKQGALSDYSDGNQELPRTPLQAINRMAPPDRPIQEIRASTLVDNAKPQPEDPQEPPRQPQRSIPQFPVDRAAWSPSEPFIDPGGKSADPQRSAYQSKTYEQTMASSEAMDRYGMQMVEFAQAVEETLRVLTRRLNDITRSIQGEGYDIR